MDDRFNTLTEFVNWLVSTQLGREGGWATYWFRGHPYKGLSLQPRMLRHKPGSEPDGPAGRRDPADWEEAEQQLNQEFHREAASLLPAPLDVVNLYFLAQHHGLPTRLLDWTTNGLAALFFTAVSRPDEDGEVIVTAPDWRLTTSSQADPRAKLLMGAPFPQRHALVREAIDYLFGEGQRPDPPLVLPILPDLRSPRMLQQGACFTLHLPGSGGVDEHAVVRFTIPRAKKSELIRALRTLGISWSTLFPDLDHLCREIAARWDDLIGHDAPEDMMARGINKYP